MISPAPTLSGLGLVAHCPGSASLPRQARASGPAANLGTAIHELIAREIDRPVREGVEHLRAGTIAACHDLSLDDTARLDFLAQHMRLPVPDGALAEVPLGYFPDGSVRRIEGGAGQYPDVGQALSGTLDAMWAEPEPLWPWADGTPICSAGSTLWVVDWKTGDDENVPPIERNWQLRAGALMVARWTGATNIIPAICYVNAAECAQAVRAGRIFTGRWEVGAPLDAAPLDAIEVELRAVLWAARGESDAADSGSLLVLRDDREMRAIDAGRVGGEDLRRVHHGSNGHAPLILGPWCEHCHARAACPAFAAEALSLARAAYPYTPTDAGGMTMTEPERAYLAGIIPAMRATLDRAEEALRAGGPVVLADGRVYAPAIEVVTGYRTQPTFDALAAVVGEERANDAAVFTTTSIKAALADAGAPRGAFGRLRAEIDAAGGLVLTGREVWRKRYPAVPVEVEDGDERQSRGGVDDPDWRGDGRGSGGDPDAGGAEGEQAPPREAAATGDDGGGAVVRGGDEGDAAAPSVGNAAAGAPVTRAICPTCGKSVAVNRKGGDLRAHMAPGTSLYCRPAPAQTAMVPT